ncbi:penicillin-binding transpeptidase domain-containing protein [Haloimpatiens sp. FM7315]|uniref:penicillin-binding transpeptidase domain-containing protein n=1 Tax=Haloimpatiens sp. FM7315 TaxID=3298609 RepID=UPI00370A80CB
MQTKSKKKKKKFTRYTALILITVMVISSIIGRLVYLQVIQSDKYKILADRNYIRNISTSAPRGDIVDRNNVVLASSKQSFNLTYMETKESKKVFFATMEKVFQILSQNGEIQEDDFALKVKPYRFDFKAVNASDKKWLELRFKKDRGLNDKLAKDYYEKNYADLDKEKDKDKIQRIEKDLLKITPEETFKYLVETYEIIGQNLSLEEQRKYMIVKDNIKMQSFSGYKPVVIAKNLKKETAFKFYERLNELPGIDVGNEPIRYYPYGELGSSVLGYISKINTEDKDSYEEKGYDVSTDTIGVSGIEKAYESRLRGSKGQRTVKVNKYGRIVEELFKKNPYSGEKIQLTIDAKLQNAAEKALDKTMENLRNNPRPDPQDLTIMTSNATRGAAVVFNVKTGEVLALASRPGFDPNIFTIPGKLTDEASKKYFNPDLKEFGTQYIESMALASGKSNVEQKLNQMFPLDKRIENNTTIREDTYDIVPKPFYNYATFSLTPPGSTFKPLTAIAGLEDGVINGGTTVVDTGTYTNYGGSWNCWKRGGHGVIGVVNALKESCNYFFYNVGSLLYEKYKNAPRIEKAYDIIKEYAEKFGLGVKTGIEIPEKIGSAYNFKSTKENKTIMFYYSCRDILKAGFEQGRNKKFVPIDITIRENKEDKSITEAKKKIKETIKSAIQVEAKKKNSMYAKYIEDMKTQLKVLVSSYDKDKQSKYTDEQIEKAASAAIDFCIWDANIQIYTPGNVINASIGQGDHQFTPVQLANYVATIANGGHRYEAHLFKKAYDDEDNVVEEKQPKVISDINLKDSTIEVLKEGMKGVTSEEGGTATKAFAGFPIQTAGKTGSATFSATQNEVGRTSFGVFVGYAPADNPEIAVSVVIFDGGHGGYVAPVARAVYEEYFAERLKKEYPAYTPTYNYELKAIEVDQNNVIGDTKEDKASDKTGKDIDNSSSEKEEDNKNE